MENINHQQIQNSIARVSNTNSPKESYPLTLNENAVKKYFYEKIPSHFKLSFLKKNIDNFFEAVAQVLKYIDGIEYTAEFLASLCEDYIKNGEHAWVDETLRNFGQQNGANSDKITGGRPQIEGRILCEIFNIELHIIKISRENTDEIGLEEYKFDKLGGMNVALAWATYDSPKMLHLIQQDSIFVPLVDSRKIPVETHSLQNSVEHLENIEKPVEENINSTPSIIVPDDYLSNQKINKNDDTSLVDAKETPKNIAPNNHTVENSLNLNDDFSQCDNYEQLYTLKSQFNNKLNSLNKELTQINIQINTSIDTLERYDQNLPELVIQFNNQRSYGYGKYALETNYNEFNKSKIHLNKEIDSIKAKIHHMENLIKSVNTLKIKDISYISANNLFDNNFIQYHFIEMIEIYLCELAEINDRWFRQLQIRFPNLRELIFKQVTFKDDTLANTILADLVPFPLSKLKFESCYYSNNSIKSRFKELFEHFKDAEVDSSNEIFTIKLANAAHCYQGTFSNIGIDTETVFNQLVRATKKSDLKTLSGSINAYPDLINNCTDKEGLTLFLIAAKEAHKSILEFLKLRGAQWDSHHKERNALYYVLFYHAGSQEEREKKLEYLLKLGLEFDHPYFEISLSVAWQSITLEKDVNMLMNLQDKWGSRLVHYAAAWGNVDAFKWLIKKAKFNLEVTDKIGLTAIHRAAACGQLKVFEWLYEQPHSIIDLNSELLSTCLYFAINNGHLPLVHWLFKILIERNDHYRVISDTRLKNAAIYERHSVALYLDLVVSILKRGNKKEKIETQLNKLIHYMGSDKDSLLYFASEFLLSSRNLWKLFPLRPKYYHESILKKLLSSGFRSFNQRKQQHLFYQTIFNGISLSYLDLLSTKGWEATSGLLNTLIISKQNKESLSLNSINSLGDLFAAKPPIKKLIFQNVKLQTVEYATSEGSENIKEVRSDFAILNSHLQYLKDHLEELSFVDCDLTDDCIIQLADSIPKLIHLTTLNLDGNKITQQGFKELVSRLYKDQYTPKALAKLSLQRNLIDIQSKETLQEIMNKINVGDQLACYLSGNVLISQKRGMLIRQLLADLLINSGLSIKEFLTCTFISLEKDSFSNTYTMNVKLKSGEEKVIPLNVQFVCRFNKWKTDQSLKTDAEGFNEIQKCRNYLNEMPDDILVKKFNDKAASRDDDINKTCKRLLNYHPNSPLKSYLETHPFLRNQKFNELPCLLSDGNVLTHTNWRVYLLAKKEKGEHAMLAYEGMTGNGQRFIQVAHLIAPNNNIKIEFYTGNNLKTMIDNLKADYWIASWPANRTHVKTMHDAIEKETNEGIEARFKWLLLSTTNEEQINCLKWSVDKLKKYCGIALNINIYQPSVVVKKITKNSDAFSYPISNCKIS